MICDIHITTGFVWWEKTVDVWEQLYRKPNLFGENSHWTKILVSPEEWGEEE